MNDNDLKRFKIAKLKRWVDVMEDEGGDIELGNLKEFFTQDQINSAIEQEKAQCFEYSASDKAIALWTKIKELIRLNNLKQTKNGAQPRSEAMQNKLWKISEAIQGDFDNLTQEDKHLFRVYDYKKESNAFEGIEDYPPPIPLEYSGVEYGRYNKPKTNADIKRGAKLSLIKAELHRLTTPEPTPEKEQQMLDRVAKARLRGKKQKGE